MDCFVSQTVIKTVVILDSFPNHKSKKFMAKLEEWKEKDMLIFFFTSIFTRTEPN
jgi:translation initiation factor 2B subunit (eIF-2B alpha/beta/delta family)